MLSSQELYLINGQSIDAVPARLYRAKSNAHARLLSQSDWLIRLKKNGRYIAYVRNGKVFFLYREVQQTNLLDAITELFNRQHQTVTPTSIADIEPLLAQLHINSDSYFQQTHLAVVAEPQILEYAGYDRYRRPLWLEYQTKSAWQNMRTAAFADSIVLEAISGFRSYYYQMSIFQAKLMRGISIQDILTINAAPGYSEHHSGRALDISCQAAPAADESFEHTPAFAWLQKNALSFGFRMSFPRNNPHKITYEPWHWYWLGTN